MYPERSGMLLVDAWPSPSRESNGHRGMADKVWSCTAPQMRVLDSTQPRASDPDAGQHIAKHPIHTIRARQAPSFPKPTASNTHPYSKILRCFGVPLSCFMIARPRSPDARRSRLRSRNLSASGFRFSPNSSSLNSWPVPAPTRCQKSDDAVSELDVITLEPHQTEDADIISDACASIRRAASRTCLQFATDATCMHWW
eukprot:1008438-Rhodomonas_salina.2